MESATSAVNWQPVNVAKRPGELLLDSLRHVARGSDTVGFFQWRASRAGGEKYHSALVPHAGPDSARFREVVGAGLRAGRARRGGRQPGATPTSRCSGTGRPGGPATCPRTPPPGCATSTPPGAGTARSPSWARRPTSCTRRPTCRGYRLVVVPTLYLCSDAAAAGLAALRARRRARSGQLLLRDRRRGRPRPAGRLPGGVPRAARGAGRGVRAAAARGRRSPWTTAAGPTCGPRC